MNRNEIEDLIPHRDPFLWIDEVIEIGENRIVARKQINDDLDVFRGHYPHYPILPGVLQLEAAFQAGAILIAKTQQMADGQVPVVTRVNNTKFRNMVRPGDVLDIEVELTETLSNAFFLTGKVTVDGKTTVRNSHARRRTRRSTEQLAHGDLPAWDERRCVESGLSVQHLNIIGAAINRDVLPLWINNPDELRARFQPGERLVRNVRV